MELDLVARWTIYFFGSCFAGLAVGFLVGKLASFELGAGLGLLLPGLVSLSFTWTFLAEYRELSFHPRRMAGVVVAVEDRAANAAGTITTPVAIVEYETPDGVKRRAETHGGSRQVDDALVVVPRFGTPDGVVVGTPHEMQGGAIASMLFGTFPFSAGLFFLLSALAPVVPFKDDDRRARAQGRSYLNVAANLLMFCGILATPLFSDPVEHAIMLGFGVVSVGLWLHVVQGVRARRDVRFTAGIGVIAVNFTAWVVALWFLSDPSAGW